MKDFNKPDLEESTNVRTSHRDVDRQAAASAREKSVRENGLEGVNLGLIVVFMLISLVAGGVLFRDSIFNYGDYPVGYRRGVDPNGGEAIPTADEAFKVYFAHGQAKFATCAGCHGINGEGIGQVPPLAGSEWAQDLNTHLLAIAHQGAKGKFVVKGVEYANSGVMPAMADSWEDFDLAALATYVTNAFGKNTNEITSVYQIKDLNERLKAWEDAGNSGAVTVKDLQGPHFSGKLKGKPIGPTDMVNKKTGLLE